MERKRYAGNRWHKLRSYIIDRDNFMCRICGVGVEGKLNVHHINHDATDNTPRNLVTLCSECHKAIHMEGYQPALYEDWPAPWGDISYSEEQEDEVWRIVHGDSAAGAL